VAMAATKSVGATVEVTATTLMAEGVTMSKTWVDAGRVVAGDSGHIADAGLESWIGPVVCQGNAVGLDLGRDDTAKEGNRGGGVWEQLELDPVANIGGGTWEQQNAAPDRIGWSDQRGGRR
jgi:hypothetical protein